MRSEGENADSIILGFFKFLDYNFCLSDCSGQGRLRIYDNSSFKREADNFIFQVR